MAKKIRLSTKQPQPFHPSCLVTRSSFASYCADNGLRVDQAKLEQLHKEGWFFPALKIMRGVVEFRKIYVDHKGIKEWRYVYPKDIEKFNSIEIAKGKYYTTGSIGGFRENWLEWYLEQGMVKYPSLEKYKGLDDAKFEPDFITDWRKINKYYELFYDKRQIFLLKHIFARLNLIKSFKDKSFQSYFIKELKQDTKRFYNFLTFYIEVEGIQEQYEQEYRSDYEERLKDFSGKYKPAQQDMKDRVKSFYYPRLHTQAKKLLKMHLYPLDELEYWRRFLASKTVFGEARRSSKHLQIYLKGISEEVLERAEDANYMIAMINQFIYWVTGKEVTLHYALGNIHGHVCKICHTEFQPTRNTQVTCGRVVCVRAHKNELKKIIRKRRSVENGT